MRTSTKQKTHRNSLAARPVGPESTHRISVEVTSLYHPPCKKGSGQPIQFHDGKRLVVAGTLTADGCFVKHLKQQHILRTPPAIAIQEQAVKELQRRGCTRIIAEIDDGRRLTISLAHFVQHALWLNRGFGAQLALPLGQWHNANAVQTSLFMEVS